jgi:hypothetical protein
VNLTAQIKADVAQRKALASAVFARLSRLTDNQLRELIAGATREATRELDAAMNDDAMARRVSYIEQIAEAIKPVGIPWTNAFHSRLDPLIRAAMPGATGNEIDWAEVRVLTACQAYMWATICEEAFTKAQVAVLRRPLNRVGVR